MKFFFPYFLLACALFTLALRRGNNDAKQKKENFLSRESKANSTRKKNIDNLDYIKIPVEEFNFDSNASGAIKKYQDAILNLSEKRILNLTGISNTDLKLEYGVANLTVLSEYDNNFTALTQALVQLSEELLKNNQEEKAVKILEFGIKCRSDISKNYYLLADYYFANHMPEKIENLKLYASTLKSLTKDSIIKKLDTYL